MRAAVYYGNSQISIEDVPEPKVRDGHVKIRVSRNGICGTDLHEYYDGPIFIPQDEPHKLTGQKLPLVIGHEFSGTITELGSGVQGLAVGDRVAVEPIYRCGACRPCKSGYYNVCNCIGFHGLMSDGGMAEYTVVPQHMAHRLPESVPVEMGALVEPMAVAWHAAKLGQVNDQSRALVFGGGPIGIGVWFALRGMGLTEVDIVEPSAVRRRAVEALGARTLDPTAVDVSALIAERTGGEGVDAVYDAAGVTAAVSTALECIAFHKPMISVAIYDKPINTPLLQLVMRERRIQGSLCYTGEDYQSVIGLMEQGHYSTAGWVETIALSDVLTQGFPELRAGRKMKVLVDPSL